jgi:hypothetical protein
MQIEVIGGKISRSNGQDIMNLNVTFTYSHPIALKFVAWTFVV